MQGVADMQRMTFLLGLGLIIRAIHSSIESQNTCMQIGVAGTQASRGGFKLEVKRDIMLVNKFIDGLKDEYHAPVSWWCEKNKGVVQQADGSWALMDREHDDF